MPEDRNYTDVYPHLGEILALQYPLPCFAFKEMELKFHNRQYGISISLCLERQWLQTIYLSSAATEVEQPKDENSQNICTPQ